MGASRLAFLLLLYVALDFANPLMAGAVSFVHGAVESVQADRARTFDDLARIPPPSTIAACARPAPECLAPSTAGLPPVARRWTAPIRRPSAPVPARSPSADDH
jgi:hypothetical protein